MDIQLEIKNYRCFPDERPAKIRVRNGVTGFVGINNAGKSTALRLLYELRPLWEQLRLRQNLQARLNGVQDGSTHTNFSGIADPAEIFSNRNDRPLTVVMSHSSPLDGAAEAIEIAVTRQPLNFATVRVKAHGEWLTQPVVRNGDQIDVIPTWSSIAPLLDVAGAFADSLYIPAVRNAIQVGATEHYYDLQLGQAFVSQWDQFKAGPVKQHAERARAVEREIGRIFGLPDFEINAASDNKTLQLFIGDKSFRLHELGAGLAQFIVVMGVAAIRQAELILIDEPELNLHPALQVDFLTTLAAFSKSGVLFATHSLGLARATADDVYSVRRIEQGLSEVHALEETPDPALFAGELGFGAYRELGFSTLLLVEGPTDVKTVQVLLRRYGIEHEVLVLHLGGREQIHANGANRLVELQRITDNIHVLIDSERSDEGGEPQQRIRDFAAGCAELNVPCHLLDRRAIENYFPQRAIAAALGDGYDALTAHERLGDAAQRWNKRDNWRIAAEVRREDLDGTDLGAFLASLGAS